MTPIVAATTEESVVGIRGTTHRPGGAELGLLSVSDYLVSNLRYPFSLLKNGLGRTMATSQSIRKKKWGHNTACPE